MTRRPTPSGRRRTAATLLLLAVLASGCSGSDPGASGPGPDGTTRTGATAGPGSTTGGTGVPGASSPGTRGTGTAGTTAPTGAPTGDPLGNGAGSTTSTAAPGTAAPGVALRVEEVAGGLEHGWDVGFLPDGSVLVTQRPGRIALVSGTRPGARVQDVAADLSDVYVAGEGGLMGMVVHPDFAATRRFTTCQTHAEDGRPVDVRLVTWRLAPDGRSATRVRTLLSGLPVSTGRHSGCRPTVAADGALLVGTGDTAQASIPQDRHSLGGKLLRIDLDTGEGLPDNPFASSADPVERRILGYGHRNVQGVAVQPGTGAVYTAEHGPTFDDEVNRSVPGGNYGWDPSRGGTGSGYDESVPMTDTGRFPDAVPAVWTSGPITEAVSGATFLSGPQWGPLDGVLAVAALKGQKLLLLRLTADGDAVSEVLLPPGMDAYGRLRGVRQGPDGALYVTTSDGPGDRLLRVTAG
ncbi:PQQ-dependent sugar dehydrogenase [Nakamurella endophytica]|uniref:Glucose dehydrogenase n=1 Tax=Nakamurella endophytica TaxID=1748367 RepID=A0A917WAZ3_9ACTN|nr:PQQ-dependent sugar dehydrogenase [Nakamurella endophytica]GGL85774.1 glucose dehydrogenase [Nakamurella endophytica]